jgi:hypothetical protein
MQTTYTTNRTTVSNKQQHKSKTGENNTNNINKKQNNSNTQTAT